MTDDMYFLQPLLVERLRAIQGLVVKTADSVEDWDKVVVANSTTAVVRCLGTRCLSEGNPDALLLEQTWVVGLIRKDAITEKSVGDGALLFQIVEKLHGWTPDVHQVDPFEYDTTELSFGPTREHASLFTTTFELNLR